LNSWTRLRVILKQVPWLYRLNGFYRGWEQGRIIARDEAEYRKRAAEMGVEQDWTREELKRRLLERLSIRGIHPHPPEGRPLHFIYAAHEGDWDVVNIPPALAQFGRVTLFLLPRSVHEISPQEWPAFRTRMNADFGDFVRRVHEEQPVDFLLTYYSGHQVTPDTINRINAQGIVTATFHWDDRLLFHGEMLGGQWRGPAAVAGAYDLNLTQAPESLVKYRVEGALHMLWPLAANPKLCYPREVPFRYDVSFAGSAYGNRVSLVHYLRQHGVKVAAFGRGWPGGSVPPDKIQEIFCASRINLNFDDIGYTHYQCGKLRDFEVPMCGALMLCTHNEHLGDYFELEREIFTFRTPRECLEKIRYLLANPELCSQARLLSRERALKEHTWEARVRDLLQVIGFISNNDFPSL